MKRTISNSEFFTFVEQSIASGADVTIPVHGMSMHPFIRNGRDKAVLSPVEESGLEKGTIVLFRYNGRHIMHRIIEKRGEVFIIQGDGNDVRTFETARRKDIVAIVARIVKPSGRSIDCSSRAWLRKFFLWEKLNPIRRYIMAFDRRILGNR